MYTVNYMALAKLLVNAGMTTSQFLEAANLTVPTWHRIRDGQQVRSTTVLKIQGCLNCDIAQLIEV